VCAIVILWNWAHYEEKHTVTIKPPKDPSQNGIVLSEEDKAAYSLTAQNPRTLYAVRKVSIAGQNPYSLIGNVISGMSGVQGIFDGGNGNQNPSGTFLGKSHIKTTRTEAEITPNRSSPPVTFIEESYTGWFLKKSKLLDVMDRLEKNIKTLGFTKSLFNKDVFASTDKLQAYDIRSNLILYDDGIQQIIHYLTDSHTQGSISTEDQLKLKLIDLQDDSTASPICKHWSQRKNLTRDFEKTTTLSDDTKSKILSHCSEPWMNHAIRLLKKRPAFNIRPKEYTEWVNQFMNIIKTKASMVGLMKRAGFQNFWFQIKVSGFRTKDENGDQTYLSDTVGTIDRKQKSGPFSMLSSETDISDYQISARTFGSGL
jgi:hypothetical protein